MASAAILKSFVDWTLKFLQCFLYMLVMHDINLIDRLMACSGSFVPNNINALELFRRGKKKDILTRVTQTLTFMSIGYIVQNIQSIVSVADKLVHLLVRRGTAARIRIIVKVHARALRCWRQIQFTGRRCSVFSRSGQLGHDRRDQQLFVVLAHVWHDTASTRWIVGSGQITCFERVHNQNVMHCRLYRHQ